MESIFLKNFLFNVCLFILAPKISVRTFRNSVKKMLKGKEYVVQTIRTRKQGRTRRQEVYGKA
jgi:hypothetical protein